MTHRKGKKRDSGVVLPSVMALMLCGVAVVAMLSIHATRSMVLTRRALDYQRASYLALSGLDMGTAYVKQLVYGTRDWAGFSSTYSTATSIDTDNCIPDYDGEYANVVSFRVVESTMSSGANASGDLKLLIYSGSRNRASGIFSGMTNLLSVTFSRLGDYAAFYTRDLEAWPGENMTFKGKVHTNGDLYVGADALLRFQDTVTASGKFYAMRKPDSGYGNSAYVTSAGRVQFKTGGTANNPTYADVIRTQGNTKTRMDSSLGAGWGAASESYYNGMVKTDQNVLTPPIHVTDDEHVIIERAKSSTAPGYNRDTEASKFATKAALTIRFDTKGNLHLYSGKYVEGSSANEIPNPERLMQPAANVSKQSTTTGSYNVQKQSCTYVDEDGETQTTPALPAYQSSNYFYDTRENKAMAFADIYVDQILNDPTLRGYLYAGEGAAESGSGGGGSGTTDERVPGVLYVTYDKYEKDANGNVIDTIGYPDIRMEQHPTGEYQITGTDTKTTSTESEKNTLIGNGYTVVSSTTVTKYYFNGREVTKSQYDQFMQNSRYKRYCSTKTTTTWTLTRPIETQIMETVAVTNYIPVEPAVRIRNASDLRLAGNDADGKKRGLSIVTDLPMYVEGCFNTDNARGAAFIAGANGQTDKPDALVAADAVTMLSSNWNDDWRKPKWSDWPTKGSVRPADNLDSRVTVETTFNGILMTGIVESGGGAYSGGLQNLFRFHEHWRKNGALPYNFNGSMVCMWTSNIASSPIETTYTYQMPQRLWGWAQMNPPGLPNLTHLKELGWGRLDSIGDFPGGAASFN